MNIHYFIKKTVKILMAIAVTSTLVLTPLMITISSDSNGKIVPNFEFHRALAVLNVGVLDNQQLNVSYISGNLVMTITGNITNINVLSTIRFVYQLPDELSGILTRSTFPSGAHIDYEIRSLLGLSGTIPSSNLSLDTTLKTVTGSVFSLFGLDVGSQVTATLTVPIASFPPITDGSMQFTGIVARDAIINLSILGSEGSSKEVTIPPPTINRVTDVSTSITGTGIAGDTVHLVTSRGSFNVVVNATNSYNITLPQTLPVGSTVTATQTSPEGFTSVEYSRNVEGVILEFYTVPANIPFKPHLFNIIM